MKYDRSYHPRFCLVGSFWVWIAFCRNKKGLSVSFYSVPDRGVDGESPKQIKSTAKNTYIH